MVSFWRTKFFCCRKFSRTAARCCRWTWSFLIWLNVQLHPYLSLRAAQCLPLLPPPKKKNRWDSTKFFKVMNKSSLKTRVNLLSNLLFSFYCRDREGARSHDPEWNEKASNYILEQITGTTSTCCCCSPCSTRRRQRNRPVLIVIFQSGCLSVSELQQPHSTKV